APHDGGPARATLHPWSPHSARCRRRRAASGTSCPPRRASCAPSSARSPRRSPRTATCRSSRRWSSTPRGTRSSPATASSSSSTATAASSRLVAQRYTDATGALRLSYFAPVFREEPAMLGAEREFSQAGVELVGPSGALADAEALALLAESLARAGLRDETIEIGHIGVVRALFDDLADDARELVMRELRDGDHVGAFRRAREGGMTDAALMRARSALAARGMRDIETLGLAGIDELREVIELARRMFGGEWGTPNLALIPALPYYTGIV